MTGLELVTATLVVSAYVSTLATATNISESHIGETLELHNKTQSVTSQSIAENCKLKPDIPYQPSWNGSEASVSDYHIAYLGLTSRCEADAPIAKNMVVAAGTHKGEAWMTRGVRAPYILFEGDSVHAPHHHYGVGNEAMAYLTFIAQYYECLPEVTLFAHSHQKSSWHRSEPLPDLIDRVHWTAVKGFSPLEPERPMDTTYVKNVTRNLAGKHRSAINELDCNQVVNGTQYYYREKQEYGNGQLVAKLWDNFLGRAGLGLVPEKLDFMCGAEFFATRERIQARPRRFYLDMLSFIMATHQDGTMSSYDIGVVFERTWHVIMGEKPDYHPDLATCTLYSCSERA